MKSERRKIAGHVLSLYSLPRKRLQHVVQLDKTILADFELEEHATEFYDKLVAKLEKEKR